jgi:hypothetical protein
MKVRWLVEVVTLAAWYGDRLLSVLVVDGCREERAEKAESKILQRWMLYYKGNTSAYCTKMVL